jgi:magnesium-transporting ATPase (P-type)
LLQKFTSPLLLVLVGASVLSLFLGQRTNAIIILFMVVISGVLDFINSYKSARAMESLVSRVVTNVSVLRDGRAVAVPLHQVVPGDVVLLEPGNVVPADGRVLAANDFFVNQPAARARLKAEPSCPTPCLWALRQSLARRPLKLWPQAAAPSMELSPSA